MSQKAITINTLPEQPPHITADDDAYITHALLGSESGILSGLECVKLSDNEIRLSAGGVSNQGRILRIPGGESETLSVENGAQGVSRIDIVAADYTRGVGTSDTHVLRVIKGEPSASPVPPALITSDLDALGAQSQLALYELRLDGLTLSSVTRVARRTGMGARRVFVQQSEPNNAEDGDLWIW